MKFDLAEFANKLNTSYCIPLHTSIHVLLISSIVVPVCRRRSTLALRRRSSFSVHLIYPLLLSLFIGGSSHHCMLHDKQMHILFFQPKVALCTVVLDIGISHATHEPMTNFDSAEKVNLCTGINHSTACTIPSSSCQSLS